MANRRARRKIAAEADKLPPDTKEIQLTEVQIKAIDSFQADKDRIAQELGGALLQFEGFKVNCQQRLAKSATDERAYAVGMFKEAGVDPDKGTWMRKGNKLVKISDK